MQPKRDTTATTCCRLSQALPAYRYLRARMSTCDTPIQQVVLHSDRQNFAVFPSKPGTPPQRQGAFHIHLLICRLKSDPPPPRELSQLVETCPRNIRNRKTHQKNAPPHPLPSAFSRPPSAPPEQQRRTVSKSRGEINVPPRMKRHSIHACARRPPRKERVSVQNSFTSCRC